ncbi:hypothetical protein O181_017704 [Austropuccinia psidii MF-1]|uniref:Uncharacterized protein n=1 Tax=Austropuccinia psidii MF-1 TaxID=1389203 RepID=A0A9Q3C3W4_9BASI|nr:hypothetical protein [Austropuccinia psidii MF-1]
MRELIEEVKEHELFKPGKNVLPPKSIKRFNRVRNSRIQKQSGLIDRMISVIQGSVDKDELVEYKIIYHLMDFATAYRKNTQESELAAQKIEKKEILRSKFDMLKSGQSLQMSAHKLFEIDYYLHHLDRRLSYIQPEFTDGDLTAALRKVERDAKRFNKKKRQLLDLEAQYYAINKWLETNHCLDIYDNLAHDKYAKYKSRIPTE